MPNRPGQRSSGNGESSPFRTSSNRRRSKGSPASLSARQAMSPQRNDSSQSRAQDPVGQFFRLVIGYDRYPRPSCLLHLDRDNTFNSQLDLYPFYPFYSKRKFHPLYSHHTFFKECIRRRRSCTLFLPTTHNICYTCLYICFIELGLRTSTMDLGENIYLTKHRQIIEDITAKIQEGSPETPRSPPLGKRVVRTMAIQSEYGTQGDGSAYGSGKDLSCSGKGQLYRFP